MPLDRKFHVRLTHEENSLAYHIYQLPEELLLPSYSARLELSAGGHCLFINPFLQGSHLSMKYLYSLVSVRSARLPTVVVAVAL